MKRTSISCFSLLLLVPAVLLKAQTAFLVTGANASGAGGSVSYSIGQAAYFAKGNNTEISEGVQQAYEITTVLAAGEVSVPKENGAGIVLYPNPVKDYLYLDFNSHRFDGADYQLFDAQGKLVMSGKISQSKSEFNFSSLPSAMYIIRINQEGRNIKTFKIIKK